MFDTFLIFFIFKQIFNQNLMTGCDCWGPDGRLDTKIDKFDICHIHMSYASYIIIWHIMTYDAYDIWIWRVSIWSILVSKRPSEPQQSHPLIRFQWKNVLKLNKMKNEPRVFSLYTFRASFVFFGRKVSNLRKHFPWSLSDEPYVFRICRAKRMGLAC